MSKIYTTRRASSEDKEQIAAVMIQTLNVTSLEEGITAVETELAQHHHFQVIETNGKIVGFATWIFHGRPKHGLAEVDHIAVLPEEQGTGVARKLFDFVLQDIDTYYQERGAKLRKLFLLTRETNTRAHAFYQKLGFTLETKLKAHFYPDADECVFSLFV